MLAGAASTVGGFVAGAATFSIANAALATAKDRKRCGECKPQPSEAEAPGSGASIALGTALDAVPEALVLGVTLRAGGPDLILVVALALSNLPEALSGTAGMRLASRSHSYVLSLWSAITLGSAATTALAFHFLSDFGPDATAILKAYGAGALIAMAAETMIPEAFHNGPRYSGVLAAAGFAALILAQRTRQVRLATAALPPVCCTEICCYSGPCTARSWCRRNSRCAVSPSTIVAGPAGAARCRSPEPCLGAHMK